MAKKFSAKKDYQEDKDMLYDLTLKALRICDFSIKSKDMEKGNITGKIGMSWFSLGERYAVLIRPDEKSYSVKFYSECVLPTQLYDWGKTRKNAELFFRSLDELVNLYAELRGEHFIIR